MYASDRKSRKGRYARKLSAKRREEQSLKSSSLSARKAKLRRAARKMGRVNVGTGWAAIRLHGLALVPPANGPTQRLKDSLRTVVPHKRQEAPRGRLDCTVISDSSYGETVSHMIATLMT